MGDLIIGIGQDLNRLGFDYNYLYNRLREDRRGERGIDVVRGSTYLLVSASSISIVFDFLVIRLLRDCRFKTQTWSNNLLFPYIDNHDVAFPKN